jgi:hypothetical protein
MVGTPAGDMIGGGLLKSFEAQEMLVCQHSTAMLCIA